MRLIATALGIFLFFCVAGAALLLPLRQQSRTIEDALVSGRLESVKASAAGLRLSLQGAKTQAESVARSLEPWAGSARQNTEARAKLDVAASQSGLFDGGIFITTPEGTVSATTSNLAALMSLKRQSSFLGAAASKTLVTQVFEDPMVRVPVFAVASPLHDSGGKTTGILVASISAKQTRLDTLLASLSAEEGVQASIVDPEGQVLDSRSENGVDRDNKSAQLLRQMTLTTPAGTTSFKGPGGLATTGAWATAEDGWLIVVYQGSSELVGSAQQPLRAAALAVAILALLSALSLTLLTKRLWSAKNEAERVKRAFLAIAGHELRTPLTSIRGFSQTLEGRWDKLTDDQRKQMLSTIARQARNLENLVERLLLGAQLEGGIKQSPMLREADVTGAIEKAVQHQRAQAPLHEFQVESAPGLTATVDVKGLNQVLTQLLENAIKYSPSGGTVYVKGRQVSGGIEVTVEDEGVGLPSDLTGIFEKFGQAESVDTRVHDEGGVGLGLFIAKRHLEMMNGNIKAERREPAGARFVVRLRS